MAVTFHSLNTPTVWTSIDDVFSKSESEKIDSFLKFKVDPLVLSCCQYRLGDPTSEDYNPTGAFTSLNHNPSYLYDKVNQFDYELAEKIRLYYRGKLAFAKLRGNQMSKFRQDLEKFITVDWDETSTLGESYIGMLYKLPHFYHHDLILTNEVFDTEYQEIKKRQESWEEVTLTYIRSLDEKQKKSPSIKYWFKDQHDNRYSVSIEKTNSLIPSWEHFITKPVTIKGAYIERAYDTLHFYQVKPGWKIVG